MLSYEDCLALVDLTEDEIEAIAAHEHIPQIVAVELASYLLHEPDGTVRIRKIILDDIAEAEAANDAERVLTLKATLKHFVETHPDHKN